MPFPVRPKTAALTPVSLDAPPAQERAQIAEVARDHGFPPRAAEGLRRKFGLSLAVLLVMRLVGPVGELDGEVRPLGVRERLRLDRVGARLSRADAPEFFRETAFHNGGILRDLEALVATGRLRGGYVRRCDPYPNLKGVWGHAVYLADDGLWSFYDVYEEP